MRVGDTVKISHSGYQYTTYLEKAVELGADISLYIREYIRLSGGSYRGFDYRRARADRKCKWIYDYEADKGDVCTVINMDHSVHMLIERVYDGRQFLFDGDGLTVVEKKVMFDDEDFLI